MQGKALVLLSLIALAAGCVDAAARDQSADPSAAEAPPPAATRLGLGSHAMEPHVATRDGGRVAVVANMADVAEGPGRNPNTRIEVHRTADGGATWSSALLPTSVFAPFDPLGLMAFSGDAVLAYAPDGALYLSGVAARGHTETIPGLGPIGSLSDLSVFVTRSDDDGATWAPALYWQRGAGPAPLGAMQDKSWSAAGPDGVVHFGWTDFTSFPHTTIRYVRSADGGATWTAPAVLAQTELHPSRYAVVTGLTLAPSGGGRVYASYSLYPGGSTSVPGRQMAIASADGGATWGAPVALGQAQFPRFGHAFADPADPLRAFVVVPDGAVRATISSTSDGGATWTAPARLSARAGPEPLAAGWADAGGGAVVAYYDEAWPGGERVVAATLEDGAVVRERTLGDAPIRPAERRREYFGVAGDDGVAWVAWIAGDAATGTWVEAQRVAV